MSTVTPPPPPQPVVQTAAQPTAIVSNPPASLTSVAAGTRIDAIIVATTPDGRVEVESRLGRFLIQPNISLPKEGALQLQIQILARQIFLTITSIHGKPPFAALRKLGLGSQPVSLLGKPSVNPIGGLSSSSNPNSEEIRSIIGANLTARLINSEGQENAPAEYTTPRGRVKSNSTTNGQGPTISRARAIAAYGSAMVDINNPTSTTSTTSKLAFTAKVLTVELPKSGSPLPPTIGHLSSSAWPSDSQLLVGQILKGIVTQNPTSNTTVILTKKGPVALNTPEALPAGTIIQIEMMAQFKNLSDEIQNQTANHKLIQFLLQTRSWPALDEAFNLLRDNNFQALLNPPDASIPRPDNGLAASILRFMLNLRSGEIAGLIGDASLRLILQEKPDLVKRLRDDLRIIGRLSEEPISGDWRALPIPIANGHEIQQIHLLMRRVSSNEKDQDNRVGPGKRFIVDVELSKMGRIQLDGLVNDNGKHFDLVIRSQHHMQEAIQNEIRTIFTTAQTITGTTGWLRFQATPPKFIDIFAGHSTPQSGLFV